MSLGFALIVLIVVAGISMVANILIGRQFESYIVHQQQDFSQSLAENLQSQFHMENGSWNLDYVHGFGMYALSDGYIIRLYDADRELLWDAENHDMELCHQIMTGIQERMKQEMPESKGDFVTDAYQLSSEGKEVGYAEISYYSPYYSSENDFGFLQALNRILFLVGGLALVLAAILGVIFAGRIIYPIKKTMKLTQEIATGHYTVDLQEPINTLELKQLTRAISYMAKSLEHQEKLRRKLTSDVAHELRTPLANVSSYLEAMIEGVWEPTPERLDECYRELGRITGIVSDLEELHRIEGKLLELKKEHFDLLELAKTVVSTFETQLREKQIICTVTGEHVDVLADRGRIHQVFFNLLSNAIKYTDQGDQIRIKIGRESDMATFAVLDHGIGISEEEKGLIFERFYRTDASRSRKTGGAGIGLSIVKAVVDAHGGTILVESDQENGTCFTVRLPITEERS